MVQSNEDQEWRELFACLNQEPEAEPNNALFEEASARSRVGRLVTRAVLGEEEFEQYRFDCGD